MYAVSIGYIGYLSTNPLQNASNTVLLADGAGTVRLRWSNGARNAIQTLDGNRLEPTCRVILQPGRSVAPTLTKDNSMAFVYAAGIQGLNILTRATGGATSTLEFTNERPLGTAITAQSTALGSAHRGRFTQVNYTGGAASIAVATYPGLVVGSEHEFFNTCGGLLSFVPGPGVTLCAFRGMTRLSIYGAALLKYIDTDTFFLSGALEW